MIRPLCAMAIFKRTWSWSTAGTSNLRGNDYREVTRIPLQRPREDRIEYDHQLRLTNLYPVRRIDLLEVTLPRKFQYSRVSRQQSRVQIRAQGRAPVPRHAHWSILDSNLSVAPLHRSKPWTQTINELNQSQLHLLSISPKTLSARLPINYIVKGHQQNILQPLQQLHREKPTHQENRPIPARPPPLGQLLEI